MNRGFSLLECLAAIALLGLIVTTSLVVLTQKRAYLRSVSDQLRAAHAVEKEIETALARDHRQLAPRQDAPFLSEPSEVKDLPEVSTSLTIRETEVSRLRRLTARVAWTRGTRKEHVGEMLFCSETP